jgi:DNA-binding MarR family transcriptional regulator
MDRKQLFSLVDEVMRAFAPFYQEAMQRAIQEWGAPDNWFVLSLARGSDPAPLSVERLQALSPYTARTRLIEGLEKLAQLELLERLGVEAYRLTDMGREAVKDIYEAAHQELGEIQPLPAEDMAGLNSLLQRLVAATLEAPEPEEKWAITYSRWTDPGEGAPGSIRTDQFLTDMLRYRDDAHTAAWKQYNISGTAWEALTFIWRGDANTAEELVEKLPFRSHTVADYEKALHDLVARGWAVAKAGAYQLTPTGRQIREDAEEATDRFYFAPWAKLSDDEVSGLYELLTRLKDNLREMNKSSQGS